MGKEQQEQRELLIQTARKNFQEKGFQVEIQATAADALMWLKKEIQHDESIGYGGSRTLEQIGFFEAFQNNHPGADYFPNLIDRNRADLTQEEKVNLWRKALTADVFLCSANGVSISGELILIDRNGNRNAAATFGPKKRIFVVGWNKLQKDFETAMEYAKNIACVQNNLRFHTENPCTKAGKCLNCNTFSRLCCITTIITQVVPTFPAVLLLIKEDLGF